MSVHGSWIFPPCRRELTYLGWFPAWSMWLINLFSLVGRRINGNCCCRRRLKLCLCATSFWSLLGAVSAHSQEFLNEKGVGKLTYPKETKTWKYDYTKLNFCQQILFFFFNFCLRNNILSLNSYCYWMNFRGYLVVCAFPLCPVQMPVLFLLLKKRKVSHHLCEMSLITLKCPWRRKCLLAWVGTWSPLEVMLVSSLGQFFFFFFPSFG